MTRTEFEANLAKKMFIATIKKNGLLDTDLLIDVIGELLSRMIYYEHTNEINERNHSELVHVLKRVGVLGKVEVVRSDGTII